MTDKRQYVSFLEFNGSNIEEVADFLWNNCSNAYSDHRVNNDLQKYFPNVFEYGEADIENPKAGDVYIAKEDGSARLLTKGEFEAGFKLVDPIEEMKKDIDVDIDSKTRKMDITIKDETASMMKGVIDSNVEDKDGC